MIKIKFYFSREATTSVVALVCFLLATIVVGAALAWRNHELQYEFDDKNRVLLSLGGQLPLNAAANGTSPQQLTRLAAIAAPTETVAASQLHQIILTQLQKAGGSVHSIQAEATTDTIGDGLRRLNAQISFDSSIDALQKLLFNLETTVPFIFVDSIVVQPAPTSAVGTMGEALRVTLVTSSYWKDLSAEHRD